MTTPAHLEHLTRRCLAEIAELHPGVTGSIVESNGELIAEARAISPNGLEFVVAHKLGQHQPTPEWEHAARWWMLRLAGLAQARVERAMAEGAA